LKISTREKTLICVTLVFIFLVLYFNLFYKKIYQEITIMKDQIHRNKEGIETTTYSQAQVDELKNKILELERRSNQIQQTVDTKKVTSQIIVFIEEAIEDFGLGTKLTFSDTQEHKEYNVITITLNFETNYDNIKKIISNIEKAPWPLIMDNIKLNKKQSNLISTSFDWDVEVILHFLIFPKDKNS